KIRNHRSESARRGYGLRLCKTSSCCRRHRFSATSQTFRLNKAAIATPPIGLLVPPAPCRCSGSLPSNLVEEKLLRSGRRPGGIVDTARKSLGLSRVYSCGFYTAPGGGGR